MRRDSDKIILSDQEYSASYNVPLESIKACVEAGILTRPDGSNDQIVHEGPAILIALNGGCLDARWKGGLGTPIGQRNNIIIYEAKSVSGTVYAVKCPNGEVEVFQGITARQDAFLRAETDTRFTGRSPGQSGIVYLTKNEAKMILEALPAASRTDLLRRKIEKLIESIESIEGH